MDPMTTAALISTGGNLISGLLGKDKKQKIDYEGAQRAQTAATREDFAVRMDLASKYNIHPLAMLGTQSPSISAPVYESKSNNMGQNVAQSLAKGASDYFTGKANREIEQLSLDRARLENDLLRSQITSINRSASTTTSAVDQTSSVDPRYKTQIQQPLGQGDQAPMLRQGVDKYGNKIDFYNDQLGDNELMQALVAGAITVPQMLATYGASPAINAIVSDYQNTKHRKQLQKGKNKAWAHQYRQIEKSGFLHKYQKGK